MMHLMNNYNKLIVFSVAYQYIKHQQIVRLSNEHFGEYKNSLHMHNAKVES